MKNPEAQEKFRKERAEKKLAEENAKKAAEKAQKDEEERQRQVAEEAEREERRVNEERQKEDARLAREREEKRRNEQREVEKNKLALQRVLSNEKLESIPAAALLTFSDFIFEGDIDEVGAWTDVQHIYGTDKQLCDIMLSGSLHHGLTFERVVPEESEALKHVNLRFESLSGNFVITFVRLLFFLFFSP